MGTPKVDAGGARKCIMSSGELTLEEQHSEELGLPEVHVREVPEVVLGD